MKFTLQLKRTLVALVSLCLTTQPVFAELKFRVPLTPEPSQVVGNIQLSESALDFTAVPIGTSAQKTVQVTNAGAATVTLDDISLTGEGFSSASTCGTFLLPAASCNVTVTFSPLEKKVYAGGLAVVGDEGRSTTIVTLGGEGQTGRLMLAPARVGFEPALQVGDAAPHQFVTVTNTGIGPVSDIRISVVNQSGYADFTQSNNCAAALRSNESCTVAVGFTPMTSGTRAGVLAVASDSSNGVQTATLTGEGVLPSGSLTTANFGTVQVGKSKTTTSEFKNTGVGALSVETVTVTSGVFSLVSHTCPNKLAAGEACAATMRFAPTQEGAASGSLMVQTTEAGEVRASLSGNGQAPNAALGAPELTATKVGQQSTAEATLTNTGIDTIGVTPPAASSVTGADFRFASTTCGTSLAAGQSCVIRVIFAPQEIGTRTGSLSVSTGAGVRAVALSGLATDVLYSVSPLSLNLGQVPVGQAKTSSTVTVTNTGNLPVEGIATAVTGNYSVTNSTCPASLSAGASCTFQVKLTASAPAAYSGQVQVSASNTPSVQNVTLTGQGVQGNLSLSTGSLSFASTQVGQTSAAQGVLLTNEGAFTLALTPASVTGDFSVVGTSCSSTLDVGQSCQVNVVFAPTSATNPRTGTLTLANDGTSGSQTVSLSGSGALQSATLSDVTFPSTDAGASLERTATLVNTGVGPLSVTVPSSASVTGSGFTFVSTSCASPLAVGDSCQVTVAFAPAANQDYSGTLTVATGAGSKTAALSGTGKRAVLVLSPATLPAFGNVQVGQTKDSTTLTLTNSGNGNATGLALAVAAGYSVTNSTCTATLAAGAACSLNVRFAPQAVQSYTGALDVSAAAPAVGTSLSVTGAGSAQTATLSDVSFGSVTASTTSNLTATLTNTGVGPLSLTAPSSASVTGAGFSFVSTTCGASIAVGGSCTVTVAFSPSANQAYSGTLSLTSGAGALTSSLSGTGLRAVLALTPATLADFGNVQVGQTKDSVALTLSNTGNTSATSLALTVPTGYSVQNSTCGTTLGAGGSCGFTVRLSPTLVQAYTGNLSVSAASPATGVARALTGAGVAQSASLGSLNFGSRASSSSTDLVTTLSNTGVGPLSLTVPTSSSVTGAAFSFVSTTCGTSVATGGSCAVTVRFSPTSSTSYSGSVSVASGAGTLGAALTGVGLQGTGTASSTNLTFGSVQVAQTSAVQVVTMTNNGTQALTFSGISVAVGSTDFAQSNNCGATLAVGASCSLNIAFTPAATGTRTGTVVALHDGPGGRTDISLSGTGVAQAGTLSDVSFGSVTSGGSSTLTATLTNTGIGPLSVTVPTSTSVSGAGFAFVSTTCSSTLELGASCTTSLSFTPSANQAYNGTLTVATGAGTLTSSLTGTGTRAVLAFTPSTLSSFGNVQVNQVADSASLTLTNSGNATASSLTVTPPAGFSVQSSTCGTSLAAGASCTMTVRFSPVATQLYSGNLSVTAAAPAVGTTLALSGTGVAQSGTLSPVAFGNVTAGTSASLTATLTNTGAGPLSITAPTAASVTGAGFSFTSTTCAASLSAGSSCTVTVSFAPAANQAYTGTLTVSTGAGSLAAALTGTGTRAVLALSPANMYNFGNVQVGQTLDSSTVTLTNSGNATATSLTLTPGTAYSLVSSTCGTSLAAGASCTFIIRFAPVAVQSYTTGLSVSAAAPAVGTSYAGTGVGVGQSATLGNISFGSVTASTTSTLTSTLTNTGVGPLSITTPAAGSVSGTGFSFLSTTCGTSLAAGGTCTVSVNFTPTANATYSGTLTVVTGAGSLSGTLGGTGTRAVLGFSPATLSTAANTQVGQVSDSAQVTLTNSGNATASTLAVNAPTGFSIVNSTCGTSLAASSSCTFNVRFAPAAAQGYSGNVTATATSPAVGASLAVSGTGYAQSASLGSIAYGSRAVNGSTDLTSTLTNTGIGTLTLTAPTASSVTGSGFSFLSTTCGTSLAVSGTCTVTVRFSPADTASYSGTLSIATGGGTVSGALSGTGSGSKATATTTTSLSTGSVSVGAAAPSASVTYRNDGNATMTLTASSPAAPFSLTANTCTSIAPGGTCTVSFSLATSSPGTYSGSSSVSGASLGGGTVSLSGTVAGSISTPTTSTSMTFTTTGYASAQPTATLTVRNDGNAAMTLTPSLSNTTNFSVSSNGCSGVAAGSSCNIVFAMSTGAIGTFSSSVTVSGGSTGSFAASLGGTVTGVSTSWNSTSLSFGTVNVGSSSSLTVVVNNNGNVSGNLQSLTNLPTGFTSSGCTAVAAGTSCTMTITFTPTAGTSYSGSSIYPSAASTVSNTLSVSGTGLATSPPALAMSPTSWAAGSVQDMITKTQSVTLTNTGGAGTFSLTIGNYVGTGMATLSYARGTCPADGATFGAGASCTFSVSFTGYAQCGGSVRSQQATVTATSTNAGGSSSASIVFSGASYVYSLTSAQCR